MTEARIIYRNQSINLQSKSVDWFLYDSDVRHERVKRGMYFLQYTLIGLIFVRI